MKIIQTIILIIFCIGFVSAEDIHNIELINSVLWQKTSAEYRALAYQAFNLAQLRLSTALQQPSDKPLAIIVDLDETVLDNSGFEAQTILEGKEFYNDFQEWVDKAMAKTVPGATDFLNFAYDNQVEVYYISNRNEKYREGTIKNLLKLGFPNADNAHVLLRNNDSNKQPRRDIVLSKFNVVLLMGDNLIDFLDVFRKKTISERYSSVDSLRTEFGKRFIILPNPMYGEWEKTIYGGTRKIDPEKKQELRIKALQNK